MFPLSLEPISLQQTNSINLGKGTTTLCMLEASLYRPALGHFTLFLKNKSTCQNHTTLVSVKTKCCNLSKQLLHIALSHKHELSNLQAFQNTKTPSSFKTGQLLHFDFKVINHSCVLSQTSSNTFHITHLSYPNHWPLTVTSFASFTISDFSSDHATPILDTTF